jgi:phosphatidate cytidylyltransferase
MLKQRILTALILIPIFVFLVLKLSQPAFMILTAIIVLWGAWEWSAFMGVVNFPHVFFYPLVLSLLLIPSLMIPLEPLLCLTLVWWLIALVLVVLYPKASQTWGRSIWIRGLMGFLVLIPCWRAINFIHGADEGPYKLLFLFVLIWGADTFAFFAGRQWGKHKLAPHVSPGKSLQGLCGALVGTAIITVGALFLFGIPQRYWLGGMALSMATVLFSVLGDLFESMLKRNVGLKDSGQLLPGHGGILDRIDSLTAAAPIFALGAIGMWEIFH